MYQHFLLRLDDLLRLGWLDVLPPLATFPIVVRNRDAVLLGDIVQRLWVCQFAIFIFHEELDSITTGTTGKALIHSLRRIDAEVAKVLIGVERTQADVLNAPFPQRQKVADDIHDIRRALDFLFRDSVHKVDITE